MRTVISVLALPLVAGCYTYHPATTVRPGQDVRARLHNEAAIRRSSGLDEPIIAYSGRLLQETDGSITLDVLIARDPSQFRDAEIRESVTIERSEIQTLMVRELSPARTALFTGAVIAGAAAIVTGISAIVGGNEDDLGGTPPPAASVSLFRLQPGAAGWRVQVPSFRSR